MKQCQVMGVRCQLMIHVLQEIRRNEDVINALKQKVLDMYTHWHVNSSWHSDAIWQINGSTLAQLMVCCLTAPSYYMNQCWLINWLRDMHLRAISQEVLKNYSICNLNGKFTLLKYFEHLPGTDVLNNLQDSGSSSTLGGVGIREIKWGTQIINILFDSAINATVSKCFQK